MTALQLFIEAVGDLAVVSLEEGVCLGLSGQGQVVEHHVEPVALLGLPGETVLLEDVGATHYSITPHVSSTY